MVGRPLGKKYVVGDRIGRGGMGEVYLGADQAGTEYAVKMLRQELATDAAVVSRFVQERSILFGVKDPHLVQVHDLVVEGEDLAIVMDLVRGPDLRHALTSVGGVLPPAEVARLGAGIAAGLAVVHNAGVVHRDVKPENVLLDTTVNPPIPRLTDFGISRLISESRLGRTTLLVGTPQYMAPELSEGVDASRSSDIYALGIMLYELCCGVTPFHGGSVATVIRSHGVMMPGRPPGIPDPMWDLIAWCLAKAPASRPQSARQVSQILQGFVADHAAAPAAPALQAPPPGTPLTTPSGTPTEFATDMLPTVTPASVSPDSPTAVLPSQTPEPATKRSRRAATVGALTVVLVLLLGGVGWAVLGGGGDDDEAQSTLSPVASESPEPSATPGETPTPSPSSTPSTEPSASTSPSDLFVGVDGRAPDGLGYLLLSKIKANAGSWDEKGTVSIGDKIDQFDSVYASANQGHCSVNEERSVEYQLDGKFTRLSAFFGLTNDTQDSGRRIHVAFYLDGAEVLAQDVVRNKAYELELDLKGRNYLKIQWRRLGEGTDFVCGRNYFALASPKMYGEDGQLATVEKDED